MTDQLFELIAPACWSAPMVFSSPHSGTHLPAELLQISRLGMRDLRASEDSHVDSLFMGCIDAGAPMLRALASRAFLDLNREPYELDARLFSEPLPGYMNPASPRVAAGFGTIPKLAGDGLEIYRGRMPLAEAIRRIENIYKPYHRTLNALLHEGQAAAGIVLLVDCHSMPATATRPTVPTAGQVDVVLGDRFGTACAREISDAIESHLSLEGLHVVRNRPYAGGFITEAYGAPQHGRHAVQLEVNRGLYMNEHTLERLPAFDAVKPIFDRLAARLEKVVNEFKDSSRYSLAAE